MSIHKRLVWVDLITVSGNKLGFVITCLALELSIAAVVVDDAVAITVAVASIAFAAVVVASAVATVCRLSSAAPAANAAKTTEINLQKGMLPFTPHIKQRDITGVYNPFSGWPVPGQPWNLGSESLVTVPKNMGPGYGCFVSPHLPLGVSFVPVSQGIEDPGSVTITGSTTPKKCGTFSYCPAGAIAEMPYGFIILFIAIDILLFSYLIARRASEFVREGLPALSVLPGYRFIRNNVDFLVEKKS
ncbi:hypothetical protein HK100_009971 [Physocladia obscura]|uniref:Uncharacterized protein n=1 Tax=Physocladia obscura TaxID=109957 RepID=A0AAD5T8W9_9FUNG|nr:hypothetical protein HK100_009971 [Physocladia obscura]